MASKHFIIVFPPYLMDRGGGELVYGHVVHTPPTSSGYISLQHYLEFRIHEQY